jgi:hypothetical protein
MKEEKDSAKEALDGWSRWEASRSDFSGGCRFQGITATAPRVA